ncbi:hypothetical protein Fot_14954 [Forsythia ovata]|uniref:Uncharacterized protein n=1 Tax=Forsythia ovata TaxID=205694 RepID=A0ABD1W843_9LAMI
MKEDRKEIEQEDGDGVREKLDNNNENNRVWGWVLNSIIVSALDYVNVDGDRVMRDFDGKKALEKKIFLSNLLVNIWPGPSSGRGFNNLANGRSWPLTPLPS